MYESGNREKYPKMNVHSVIARCELINCRISLSNSRARFVELAIFLFFTMSEVFDVVIVGGGTAGLALATRLSEDPSLQIVVLEAGEDLTEDPRVSTPFLGSSLIRSSADWQFRTAPQVCFMN